MATEESAHDLAPEIARLTFLTAADKLYLDELAREFSRKSVVLFVGAGFSKNAESRRGGKNRIPTWWELASQFRARLDGKMVNERDILKIADYYEAKYGRGHLEEAVVAALQDDDYLPGRVHDRLVDLRCTEIITTNFDTLIERAVRKFHIAPQVVILDSDLVWKRRYPRILKINGCVTNRSTIVLTGNDFLGYSRNHPLIDVFVTKCFVESTVLFLGFSLDDPAFRSINEKVFRALGPQCRQAYSLQSYVSDEQRKHWSGRKVQLVNLAVSEGVEYERVMFETLSALAEVNRRLSLPYRLASLSRLQNEIETKSVDTLPRNRAKLLREDRSMLSPQDRAEITASVLWSATESLLDPLQSRQGACQEFWDWTPKIWSFDGLANMAGLRGFLTFSSLFAPIPALLRLASSWVGPNGENDLVTRDLRPVSTPEEYRIPLLGLCGLLERSPVLYDRAANSLWARRPEVDEQASISPDWIEVAYRFRYLMRAGGEST